MIVYLLCENNSFEKVYKIGVTKNKSTKRIKGLQTGNSNVITVVNQYTSKWAWKIESALHAKYKLKHKHGEWYYLEETDITDFVKLCEEYHDIFEMFSKENTYVIDKKIL